MNRILDFWFAPENKAKWFVKDSQFDQSIKENFENDIHEAHSGKLNGSQTPEGTLALIILLDQFPRNIYRNTPRAFEFDSKALLYAQRAIAHQQDQALPPEKRIFIYLPFEHSENLTMQEQSVELFRKLLNSAPADQSKMFENTLQYAIRHWEIIRKFGRFPHRNEILKRTSTPEEKEFLETPFSSF